MRVAHLALCLLLINSVSACSDDATKDASGADTTSDVSDATGDSAAETTETVTNDPDATEPDTTPDVAPDTAPETTTDTSDGEVVACEYFEEREIIKCGQANAQVLHWKDFGAGGCAPYYTRGDDRYDTIEALAQAEGCDATCVYVARQAVDFIRCDGQGRSGWETYQADGEGCLEAIYSTPDGIFTDLCFWAQYACYCEQ